MIGSCFHLFESKQGTLLIFLSEMWNEVVVDLSEPVKAVLAWLNNFMQWFAIELRKALVSTVLEQKF